MYNYLMDYYGNERIVLKQHKEIEARLQDNQVITRDKFQRFVIAEKTFVLICVHLYCACYVIPTDLV